METREFQISADTLKAHGEELLRWGQEKKLEPAELCIVLQLTSDFIRKEVGIERAEISEHTVN